MSNGELYARSQTFQRYAISNFRGGIGKSTLSFNLAYELAQKYKLLLLDTCSQKNFSQNLLGDDIHSLSKSIYNSLVSEITGTSKVNLDDLLYNVKISCAPFKFGKDAFLIPGSTDLYLFPSLLYSTLAQYNQIPDQALKLEASARIINAIKTVIADAQRKTKAEKILIDTSPFFGGATHLSWAAAEALIIPVRVDQHSIEALRLTLKMLTDENMDFNRFNKQAGLTHQPKVHAIVMTHCGWNRQKANTPDASTKFFVEKAVEIAEEYKDILTDDIDACFYLLDDFHSSGRISGKQRIPITKLVSGTKYTIDNQRLEVNPAVDRYKKEICNLAEDL